MLIQGKKKGSEQNESGTGSAVPSKKVFGFTGLVVFYYVLLPVLGFLMDRYTDADAVFSLPGSKTLVEGTPVLRISNHPDLCSVSDSS